MASWAEEIVQAGQRPPPAMAQDAEPADQGATWADEIRQGTRAEVGRLDLSLKAAQDKKPDTSVEILRLRDKTGLPADLIERNLDEVRKQSAAADFDPGKFASQSPIVAKWLADNPHHAAIGQDDMGQLSTLEWLANAPKLAAQRKLAQQDFARLSIQRLYRDLTPQETSTLNELRAQSQEGGQLGAESFGGRAIIGGAEYIPQFLDQMKRSASSTLYGATAGALMGALITRGPGATAGMWTGARAGMMVGSAVWGFEQEGGNALDEYLAMKDEEGRPMDLGAARVAAAATGVINAGLEAFQLGLVLKTIPGLSNLGGKATTEAVKAALRVPTVRASLTAIAKEYGSTLSKEVITEVAQRAVTIMSGEIAKYASGTGGPAKSAGQIGSELVGEGVGAVEGFALALLPGPAMQMARSHQIVKEAQTRQKAFEALGKAVTDTQTSARLPEGIKQIVAEATKDGPIEHIMVPVEAWDTYWQSQKLDPREVFRETAGETASYDQSAASGADLIISTADFASKLAPTEHYQALAQDLRIGADQLTGREAATLEVRLKEEEKAAQDAQAEAAAATDIETGPDVTKQMTERLVAAGVEPSAAQTYAEALYGKPFETLAKRAKVDLRKVLEPYLPQVTRQLPGEGEMVFGQKSEVTQTPQFKQWFGDSKVVDEKGAPLVVYHGTGGTFDKFDTKFMYSGEGGSQTGSGFYFTDNAESASNYAARAPEGGNVMPVFLSLNNPLHIDFMTGEVSGAKLKLTKAQVKKIIMSAPGIKGQDSPLMNFGDVQFEGFNKVLNQAIDAYAGGSNLAALRNDFFGDNHAAWLKSLAQATGHDSAMTVTANGDRHFVAWRPEQIKSAIGNRGTFDPNSQNILYQGADNPAWYSELSRQIDAAKMNSAPAQGWKDFVKGLASKGVKAAEVEAVGLNEWLDLQPGKVTKEQVQAFLAQNGVRVEDVTLGDGKRIGTSMNGSPLYAYGEGPTTKFEGWQLPGGTNYRELLLTLPQKIGREDPRLAAARAINVKLIDKYGGLSEAFNKWSPSEQEEFDRVHAEAKKAPATLAEPGFTSGHFDQPNILAHIRFNERKDAQGNRVLFIEEFQADIAAKIRALEKLIEDGKATDADRAELARLKKITPFSKTEAWTALVIKRMIRYAAENGFDKVAWTTGEQQAARYSLRKQVRRIEWNPMIGGSFDGYTHVIVDTPAGLLRINVTPKGLIEGSQTQIGQQFVNKKLDDVLGKAVAEKILGSYKGKLEGDGLEIGGEGMLAFYDKIVPNVANDVLKKLGGGRVGQFTLEGYDEATDFDKDAGKDIHRALSQPGFTITDTLRDKAMLGLPLFQGEPTIDTARGYITFGEGREIKIGLLEKANPSTFIHETGHLYLELMGDLAQRPETAQQVKDDYATILKHLGADTREAITRDQHEKWARSWEAYLMEGNAPSPALRSAFARMKSWLQWVYRKIDELQVRLNPEVRRVLDRIFASDDEIEAAKRENDIFPLFVNATVANMSDTEFGAYRDRIEKVSEVGRDALRAKLMATLKREQEVERKAQRADIRTAVEQEANAMPVYKALAAMRQNQDTDGTALPFDRPPRMNKDSIVALVGKDALKQLTGLYVVDGGLLVEQAAQMFGFADAREMIDTLRSAQKKTDFIETVTDRRMQAMLPDPLTDGTASDIAVEALYNEQRDEVLRMELKALQKLMRESKPAVQAERNALAQARRQGLDQIASAMRIPDPATLNRMAQGMIGQRVVRDIKPQTYLIAARRSAKEAITAAAKAQYVEAAQAKQKELLNNALYRAASDALESADDVAQFVRGFQRTAKRAQLGKAGGTYLDQIDALTARYEFAKVPFKTLDDRQSLSDWIKEQEAQGETMGEEFTLPPRLADESTRINYRSLTVDELGAIRDFVKQVDHLARLKNKLISSRKRREFSDWKASAIAALRTNEGVRPPAPLTKHGMTKLEAIGHSAQKWDASLLKVSRLFEWWDGGNRGPWHEALWDTASDAQAAEYDYTNRITVQVAKALVGMPKKMRSQMQQDIMVTGLGRPIKRIEALGVVLNMGNESNQDKLLRGMGWTQGMIDEIKDALSKEEMDFVQAMWDTFESMKPDVWALQKEMTGLEPADVPARPVQTKWGEYRGGYVPMIYDPTLSVQGKMQLGAKIGSLTQSPYIRATTPRSQTKTRVQSFAAPLDLDIDNLPGEIAGVIKDLTHRKWVVDANKIISDREIRQAISESMGEPYVTMLDGWVGQVVNDRNYNSLPTLAPWKRMITRVRTNVVVVGLGFRLSSMLSQTAGIGPAIAEVGAANFLRGVTHFYNHPITLYKTMTALSGEMRNRFDTRDINMRDKLRELQGRNDQWAQVQRAAIMGIAWAELLVSAPTWWGAYLDSRAQEMSEEDAIHRADLAVTQSQGAGGAKDLAAVAAKDSDLMRMFTMYYTPFSALYSQLRDIGHKFGGIKDVPRAFNQIFWVWIFAATVGELASGKAPDPEDPPEDWAKWWLKAVGIYPFLTIPILRDVLSGMAGGYGYTFSPMAQAFETTARAGTAGVKAVMDDGEWSTFANHAFKAASYWVGAPTGQLTTTGDYLYDLYNGEEHPESLGELAKNLIYRRHD